MVNAMPRQSRIDAPGALHHIIIRGIEYMHRPNFPIYERTLGSLLKTWI